MSWKRVTINDLGKIVTGNTPPKNDSANYGGVYPFIKPTDMDIGSRRVNFFEESYSEKAYQKYKRSYIPPKATGVVTIGTVGEKMFQADQWCFTNQSVNVIIPSSDYDPDFVYYLMKVNLPKVENANPGTASGRHHVSKSNFCAIPVDVPIELATQRKIAAIRSAYDDLIENNLRRIALLEEQARLVYEEWFVRLRFPGWEDTPLDEETGLPVGWVVRRIKEVCKYKGGGTPSTKVPEYWEEGSVSWFSPTDLTKASSIYPVDSARKITNLGLKNSSAKLMQPESFMMSSRATIGLFAIMDKPFATNQGFINILPLKSYHKEYLMLNLKSRVQEMINFSTGSTFLELTKSKFGVMSIKWPSEVYLERFSEVVKPLFDTIILLEKQNAILREARNLLLPRLMSGMIEV